MLCNTLHHNLLNVMIAQNLNVSAPITASHCLHAKDAENGEAEKSRSKRFVKASLMFSVHCLEQLNLALNDAKNMWLYRTWKVDCKQCHQIIHGQILTMWLLSNRSPQKFVVSWLVCTLSECNIECCEPHCADDDGKHVFTMSAVSD